MGEDTAEVIIKLTRGESRPITAARAEPSSTGRYIGKSIIPAFCPKVRCANCGKATANAIIPADIIAFTVIFTFLKYS